MLLLNDGKEYNTDPADIVAFIGPSICHNCYEVSEDVAEQFAKAYGTEVLKIYCI